MTDHLNKGNLGDLDLIDDGGQGTVHAAPQLRLRQFPQTPLVFKEYHPTVSGKLDVAVLESMPTFLESLSFPKGMEMLSLAAWPCRLVEDGGTVTGFVMPRIPDPFFTHMKKAAGISRERAEFQHLLNPESFLAHRQITISDRHRYHLLRETAHALSVFHGHGIAVGDLSPTNLLYTCDPAPAVYFVDCDSMRIKGRSVMKQGETPGWKVEDLNPREELATVASDSYKLGLLALRLLTGSQDTHDPSDLPATVPPAIRSLITSALSADPGRRPIPATWITPLETAAATASTAPPQVTTPAHVTAPAQPLPPQQRTTHGSTSNPLMTPNSGPIVGTVPIQRTRGIPSGALWVATLLSTIPVLFYFAISGIAGNPGILSRPFVLWGLFTPAAAVLAYPLYSLLRSARRILLAATALNAIVMIVLGVLILNWSFFGDAGIAFSIFALIAAARRGPVSRSGAWIALALVIAASAVGVGVTAAPSAPARRPLATLIVPGSQGVETVAFSPDGKTLAVGGFNGSAYLWDVATHSRIATLREPSSVGGFVAFSPDGKTLANGTYLWDVATHSRIATLRVPGSVGVISVAFSPKGKVLATGTTDLNGVNSATYLWDVARHSRIATLPEHGSGGVYSVAFSPNGKILASAGFYPGVFLWNVARHSRIAAIADSKYSPSTQSLAFSPNGKILASGELSGGTYLWNVASHSRIATLQPHSQGVNSVAFSPDGKTLATGDGDGGNHSHAYLFDVASHSRIAALPLPSPWYCNLIPGSQKCGDYVTSVAFSPDGKTLVAGDEQGHIYLWSVNS